MGSGSEHLASTTEKGVDDSLSVNEKYDQYDTPEDRRLMRKVDLQCVRSFGALFFQKNADAYRV